MNLVFPSDFYAWAQENVMVWWAASARWAMGRVAPGVPAEVLDEDDEPTGDLIMCHPAIDVWDQAIMAVCVAGWQYALSLPDGEGEIIAAMQAYKDAEALETLIGRVQTGEITMADAEAAIEAEIRRQATALGVDISFVDAVDDPELLEP